MKVCDMTQWQFLSQVFYFITSDCRYRYTLGYVMGAKLNFKTHLQNTYIFKFLVPFRARLASKFAINANMTQKFFLHEKRYQFLLIKIHRKKLEANQLDELE